MSSTTSAPSSSATRTEEEEEEVETTAVTATAATTTPPTAEPAGASTAPAKTPNTIAMEAVVAQIVAKAAATKTKEEAKKEAATKKSDFSAAAMAELPTISRLIERDWKKKYSELAEFKRVNDHFNIPVDSSSLYNWVEQQHMEYTRFIDILEGRLGRESTMNEDKIKLLRELGFVFERRLTKKELKWEENFKLLRRYRDKHGHCNVLVNDNLMEEEEFKGLGAWVAKARSMARKAATTPDPIMTQERIQRLVDLGLELAPKRGRKRKADAAVREDTEERIQAKKKNADARWEKRFQEIKAYKDENDHTKVPDKHPLRSWVEMQRKEYTKLQRGEPSKLDANKMQRLTDIGFVFSMRKRLTFEESLDRWIKYRLDNNGNDPPCRHPSGRWVSLMREKYAAMKQGKPTNVTAEQFDKLTELGFVWTAPFQPENRKEPRSWEERFAELEAYYKENGHSHVPQKCPKLGEFVHRQRRLYKRLLKGEKVSLNPERIAKLNSIEFVWESRPGGTRRSPGQLKRVPSSDEEDEESEEEEREGEATPHHNGYYAQGSHYAPSSAPHYNARRF